MLGLMYADEVIAGEMASGIVWKFIVLDGGVCGFLSYGCSGNDAVKLAKIYIHKDARGKGIAKAAFQRVFAYAKEKGRSSIFLTVNKQNQRAIRAYEKNGFRIAEATVFSIGGGFVMDDYVMRRSL